MSEKLGHDFGRTPMGHEQVAARSRGAIVVAMSADPLGQMHDNRVDAWENGELIEHLLMEAHKKLVAVMRAMEQEIGKAVARGDASGVAMMAWEYGPVCALVTDIEISYSTKPK